MVSLQNGRQSVENVFRIVVEEHNVARRNVCCRAPNQISSALVLPIQRIYAPLYHLVPLAAGDADDRVVVVPIRRTEQRRLFPGNRFQLLRHVGQLLPHSAFTDFRHVRMFAGVIADFVPAVVNLLHQLRVFVNPDAHEEERRLGIVLVKQIEDAHGLIAAPRGVEGNRDHAVVALDGVNRQNPLGSEYGRRVLMQRPGVAESQYAEQQTQRRAGVRRLFRMRRCSGMGHGLPSILS